MSWLFPSHKSSRAASPGGSSGARRRAEAAGAGDGSSARRKHDRAGRRELLYGVVREAMVRAGVLSASYKFKVLSLDGEGRQFMVMIDLAQGAGHDAGNLAEIEALIAQSAKARHEIFVMGVYWRVAEHGAIGRADTRFNQRRESHPMPLDSQPAPLHSAPAPLTAPAARGPAYEPIQADEVEAFKKALVAASRPAPLSATPATPDPVSGFRAPQAPRNYTLITGYEDTELPDSDRKTPVLSGTQFGELR